MLVKLPALTVLLILLTAWPASHAQAAGSDAAAALLQRDALRKWMTFGRTGHYTPEKACRDAIQAPDASTLASCEAFIQKQQGIDRQHAQAFQSSRKRDDETLVAELVRKAAQGDQEAAASCQWGVGGLQRDLEDWKQCRERVQNAAPKDPK